MKMLKNGLEVDGFAISRTPTPSPRSTKRVVVPRCAARPPEPPAQVHPDHHAEDGAVAEHADGAEPVDEVVVYKNRDLSSTVQYPCVTNVKTRWPPDGNANAGRHDVDRPPNDHDAIVKWGVSRSACLWGFSKLGMGSPKPSGIIKPSAPSPLVKNVDGKWLQANGKNMRGNPLIVPSCKKNYKRPKGRPPSNRSLSCIAVHDNDEKDAENNKGVFSRFSSPRLLLQPSSRSARKKRKWVRSVQRKWQPINDGSSGCLLECRVGVGSKR